MTEAQNNKTEKNKYIAISGGVGGAKLASGLASILPPENLTIIVNTGDDFNHLGMLICPDIDSVLYALSKRNDTSRGWGRADETWAVMAELKALNGEDWFQLGDRDLALHLTRRGLLDQGRTLSETTEELCACLNIPARVIPMTDDPVRTHVQTRDGTLSFQHYFVKHQCAPKVTGFQFEGAETARPSPAFLAALNDPQLAGIILCPSNPFVSINPVLSLPGMRDILGRKDLPVIAVSPIIGGAALKGPAAKMLAELGLEVSAATLKDLYQDFLSGLVIDTQDTNLKADLSRHIATHITGTIMTDMPSKENLARHCLDFLDSLRTKM